MKRRICAGAQQRRRDAPQRLQPAGAEDAAGFLELRVDGRERRLQLLIGRRQIDGEEGDQQNPQRAVEHKGRAGVAEKQADAEHDAGHRDWGGGKEAEHPRARDDAACGDIGDDKRKDGADGRGRPAQNHRVLQRELC